MTNKQCILIAIISAIMSGVFMYLMKYFPYEFAKVLFWLVSFAFCFGCFYLLIAIICTKGEILPHPYPSYYIPDPDLYFGEMKKKKEKK